MASEVRRILLNIVCVLALASPAAAWNGTGHRTIAYIAYQQLNPPTRARVDALLKLNPEYQRWVRDIPPAERGLAAFLNAAYWPDCIKGDCSGYTADGPNGGNTPPDDSTASQNLGYSDHLMHKYWHYADLPYATSGLPAQPLPKVNAISQIELMRNALKSTANDDIKSYDVVWLIHLVGDIHQPLHAISRVTPRHPTGDAGGNLVRFCNDPCESPDNLHAYWDNLMGNPIDHMSIKTIGDVLLSEPQPPGTKSTNVSDWAKRSAALAREFVYAKPIDDEINTQVLLSPRPDPAYDLNAHSIARHQVLLAAYRLANLLNKNLK
jgi:hypothetical protein